MRRFAFISCLSVVLIDSTTMAPALFASEVNPPTTKRERKAGEVIEIEIANGIKMRFCWVPEGTATLGSPTSEKNRANDEREHVFTTKGFFQPTGFWLGKYPVTQEEWAAVMKKNPSWFSKIGGGRKQVEGMDTSRFPVEQVSWNDCQDFLKKLNDTVALPTVMGRRKFALPPEDEWEYACRGGNGNQQPFYFGSELNGAHANCDGRFPYGATKTEGAFLKRTTKVGSYEEVAAHPWGLCDMIGNVWQWCDNTYDKHDSHRLLRGGCWYEQAGTCRSAFRSSGAPNVRFIGGSVRVALLP